jgi:hypothetical protein
MVASRKRNRALSNHLIQNVLLAGTFAVAAAPTESLVCLSSDDR